MSFALLVSFLVSLAAPGVVRLAGRRAGPVLALLPLGLFAYFAALLPVVQAQGAVAKSVAWVPTFGVELALRLDGLSLLFALLITGFGALVVPYAGAYLAGDRHLGRFYLALLLFMSAMLGLVLSSNLIALFVFWELTSFASYLLIGHKHEDETARASALQALLVTGGGGLALLAGLLLLAVAGGGTFSLDAIAARADAVQAHALYLPALLLIAVGCFTKSAQFPFHVWLPNAMAAPTPVSAYLHSATMVKAGIYLLLRLDAVLGGTAAWLWTLAPVGAATMVLGAVLAVRHTDLKKVLAYSTVTALGTLTLLVGLSFEASIVAALVFLVVHALYKGALFLVAGTVDHAAGTRDVRRLGGLRRALPRTATAAVLAGLSMAGLPPLFGFVGKELAYKAKLGVAGGELVLPALAVLANALTAVAAGVLVLKVFFGAPRATPRAPHAPPMALWAAPLVLAVLGTLFGLLPGLLPAPLIAASTAAALGYAAEVKLALWYGVGPALWLSLLTVALGAAGYLAWPRLQPALARAEARLPFGPARAYDAALAALPRLAGAAERGLARGGLRGALGWILGLVVVLPAAALVRHGVDLPAVGASLATGWAGVLLHEAVLAGVAAAGAVAAVAAQRRMLAVAALGATGFSVALLFMSLGAPDLAMTQFLVETLVVLIVLLVLRHLPRSAPRREPAGSRLADALLAVGAGTLVTVLALVVVQRPFDPALSVWFAERSLSEGFGRNVVNVILVDFRALDTLGEITVLAVAALGAVVLVRSGAVPPVPQAALGRDASLVLRTTTRLLITLLLLASLFLLWRGHNEPGGGFIGGLVAAGGFALYLVAFGAGALARLLRTAPSRLMAVGLAVALASGLPGLAGGGGFMAGRWLSVPVGDGAVLKLGTPLLFDVGVYLVVVGFVLTLLLTMERAPARPASSPAAPTYA